jgi:hypothetical protein
MTNHSVAQISNRYRIIACSILFLLAFSVRLLSFQDSWHGLSNFQGGVTQGYLVAANLIFEGNIKEFLTNQEHLGHPPGYPILIATFYKLFGRSETPIHLFQILCDSIATIVIFLIAAELLTDGTAIIAGLFIALSPQLIYTSLPLLPDSLAVFPILLAIYILIRAAKEPYLLKFISIGALIGISCWLRANAMFLTLFIAIAVLFLFNSKLRWKYAATVLASTILLISPITIKNWIIFHEFVPLSVGAGQTLIEGIGDYDKEGKLGMPATDVGIMQMEAKLYNRPDYALFLFGQDAIKRDKDRLRRAFSVIRSNPFWFLGVMIRRAGSMFRISRAATLNPHPPISNPLKIEDRKLPYWIGTPHDLLSNAQKLSTQVETGLTENGERLFIEGDESKWGYQIATGTIPVEARTDYLLTFPARVERGIMSIKVVTEDLKQELGGSEIYFSLTSDGSLETVKIPFVSGDFNQVRLLFSNSGARRLRSKVEIGKMELFPLGTASYLWTYYPRLLISFIQQIFKTVLILPLVIVGIGLLLRRKHYKTFLLLFIVPIYYLSIQSILHTEYRYVVAIHYFNFILAAFTLTCIATILTNFIHSYACSRASSIK